MMKAWTIAEEMDMMYDEMVISPELEAQEAEEEAAADLLREQREWLADPKNRDSEIYSDIYKDVYGVRPRW